MYFLWYFKIKDLYFYYKSTVLKLVLYGQAAEISAFFSKDTYV